MKQIRRSKCLNNTVINFNRGYLYGIKEESPAEKKMCTSIPWVLLYGLFSLKKNKARYYYQNFKKLKLADSQLWASISLWHQFSKYHKHFFQCLLVKLNIVWTVMIKFKWQNDKSLKTDWTPRYQLKGCNEWFKILKFLSRANT